MALCVQVVTIGTDQVLAPVVLGEGAACTQYVAMTAQEFALATANPFVLSLADATVIALAIGVVWATAFGFRAMAATLDSKTESEE